MNRWFLQVLRSLLFLSLVSAHYENECISAWSDVYLLQIASPRDGATIALKTSLSFSIYVETICQSFPVQLTKNAAPYEYVLRYLVNGIELFSEEATSLAYQSVIIGEVFVENTYNVITVELYSAGGFGKERALVSAQVKVYSRGFDVNAFNSILEGTVALARLNPDEGLTYLVYGFHRDLERLEQFAILNAGRLIIADSSVPLDCSGVALEAFWSVECYRDLDSTILVPYYDDAFISLSAFQNFSHFEQYLEELIRMTRSSLWVFRPKDDVRYARDSLIAYNFQPAQFHTDENKRKVDLVYENTDAWYLDTSLTLQLQPLPATSEWVSEKVHEQYEVAKSHILLKNVCFKTEGRHLYIFQEKLDTNEDNLVNVSYLAEDENRGFLYTGWELRHLAANTSEARAILRQSENKFLPGITAISISVVENHLIHGTEPTAQLWGEIPNYLSQDTTEKELQIDRLLFPLLSIHPPFRWTNTFFALMNAFRHARGLHQVSMHFKEHIPPFTCFEKLLVLGRANPHIKYWPSEEVATQFKIFVLKKLQDRIINTAYERAISISSDDNGGGDDDCDDILFPLARLASSHDGGVHVHRVIRSGKEVHQRLKVTWILRAGRARRILNLPEMQQTLLNTGLVDVKWLLRHTLYFENLDLFQQAHILNNTDILISVHSAGLFNGMFMQRGSAAIQIFNSRFAEFVFSPPLRQAGVMLLNVPSFTTSADDYGAFLDCPNIPSSCWNTSSVLDSASINCWSIRQCSVVVYRERFLYSFYEAYYHVLSVKYTR